MNFPLFVAKRIFSQQDTRRQVSRPAIRIATAGVAIGLAVMLLSVFVVLGFKHTIRDKVIGFGAHIQVSNFMNEMSSEQNPIVINDSMMKVIKAIPGVRHAERYAYAQGILKTDSDFLGVLFKGVAQEYDSTFIHEHLISGSIPQFSDKASGNKILISKVIAEKLRVKAGNRIFAYFIDKNGVRMRRFTIQGIYETNLNQYDQVICFTDLYTAVKLNGWNDDQATGAEIKLDDVNKMAETEQLFIKKVNRTSDPNGETYATQTIRDLNPQIFNWLDLLDLNVWIILALMIAVAGVTMVSGLLIIILERTTMIGVFKALGSRNATIRQIFLWFATFIIGRGMLIGNIIALGLAFLQKWTGIIRLDPATYYVSTVPVEINVPFWILLNIATLVISVLMLIVPSYLISHIHPAKSMRYE
ncbi:MAG: ABC transporter permease [Prevotella sp.]|nr:ABC transporter permease [Prevotella sp.]